MPASPPPSVDWTRPLPRSLHATGVALAGAGLLLTGPSGSGKSSLAMELLSRGAELVSDDLCRIYAQSGRLMMAPPPDVPPVPAIEARGMGLLRASLAGPAQLAACVDLTRTQTARLPVPETVMVHGHELTVIPRVDSPAFPAMLLQFLRGGWYVA